MGTSVRMTTVTFDQAVHSADEFLSARWPADADRAAFTVDPDPSHARDTGDFWEIGYGQHVWPLGRPRMMFGFPVLRVDKRTGEAGFKP